MDFFSSLSLNHEGSDIKLYPACISTQHGVYWLSVVFFFIQATLNHWIERRSVEWPHAIAGRNWSAAIERVTESSLLPKSLSHCSHWTWIIRAVHIRSGIIRGKILVQIYWMPRPRPNSWIGVSGSVADTILFRCFLPSKHECEHVAQFDDGKSFSFPLPLPQCSTVAGERNG